MVRTFTTDKTINQCATCGYEDFNCDACGNAFVDGEEIECIDGYHYHMECLHAIAEEEHEDRN